MDYILTRVDFDYSRSLLAAYQISRVYSCARLVACVGYLCKTSTRREVYDKYKGITNINFCCDLMMVIDPLRNRSQNTSYEWYGRSAASPNNTNSKYLSTDAIYCVSEHLPFNITCHGISRYEPSQATSWRYLCSSQRL